MDDAKILFKGEFNGANYELRYDGLHIYGNVNGSTRSAIIDRIYRIFSDNRNEEHKKFSKNVSFEVLYKILSE